jgi:uncharacterized membrane protein YbhN (UPF0104 family)
MVPLQRRAIVLGKTVVASAIIICVWYRLCEDLLILHVDEITLQPEWLFLSIFSYLAGLSFSAYYWFLLLRVFGQRPRLLSALRAYYIAQLGKYAPGKALVPLLRGAFIAGPDVRWSIAIIATFYEVFTTMTTGAFLSTVVFALWPPDSLAYFGDPKWVAVCLGFVCGFPLAPTVFQRIVTLFAKKVRAFQAPDFVAPSWFTLLTGMAITALMWVALGISLWAMAKGLLRATPPLGSLVLAQYTAIVAFATVFGFVVIVVPAGLGARDWMIDCLLTPKLASLGTIPVTSITALIVSLLRFSWTISDVLVACVIWSVPKARVWRFRRSTPPDSFTKAVF